MMYVTTGVCLSLFALVHLSSATYPACGGTNGEEIDSLTENIDKYVLRLKQLRLKNFGWVNTPAIALSLQLADPAVFSSLNETIARVSIELNDSIANMALGRFSQYILMLKSVCHDTSNFDGKNLDSVLITKLHEEFPHGGGKRHRLPVNGLYGFFLGLQAFCVSGNDLLDHFYIKRALYAQNKNGGFGKGPSVDLTSQALLSLECLERENKLQPDEKHDVHKAIKRASDFLLSSFVTKRSHTWIGNKYSSPYAVLAINAVSKWDANALNCKLVMDSLNIPPQDEEPESAIAQRLFALKGVTFLNTLSEDYHCGIPELCSDEPIQSSSSTVDPCQEVASSSSIPPVMITVRITVHNGTRTNNDESGPLHFTLRNVPKGMTLLEILRMAKCKDLIAFETETTSWGESVKSIGGTMAQSANREYWHISNNKRSLPVGVSQFKPSHDNHIAFRLRTWKR